MSPATGTHSQPPPVGARACLGGPVGPPGAPGPGPAALAARAGHHRAGVPNFTLTTFDGQTVSLADQKGKVVLINFWASWCIPCEDEAADLEAAWRYLPAARRRGLPGGRLRGHRARSARLSEQVRYQLYRMAPTCGRASPRLSASRVCPRPTSSTARACCAACKSGPSTRWMRSKRSSTPSWDHNLWILAHSS